MSIVNVFESIALKVTLKSQILHLCCIYRAPNNSISTFEPYLLDILEYLRSKSSIICGDFNIDLRKSTNSVLKFCNTLSQYDFTQLVCMPTHFQGNSASVIDHIIVNKPFVNCAGIFVEDFTDHLPVFCLIDEKSYTKPNFYNISQELDVSRFVALFQDIRWSEILVGDNTEDMFNTFWEMFYCTFKRALKTKKK